MDSSRRDGEGNSRCAEGTPEAGHIERASASPEEDRCLLGVGILGAIVLAVVHLVTVIAWPIFVVFSVVILLSVCLARGKRRVASPRLSRFFITRLEMGVLLVVAAVLAFVLTCLNALPGAPAKHLVLLVAVLGVVTCVAARSRLNPIYPIVLDVWALLCPVVLAECARHGFSMSYGTVCADGVFIGGVLLHVLLIATQRNTRMLWSVYALVNGPNLYLMWLGGRMSLHALGSGDVNLFP